MISVFPDYYEKFECIKEKCRHNCCIGWEIDIDEKSLEFYKTVSDELGEKLKQNISCDAVPHFILKSDERCPFLNGNNLCELIINLGKDSLCDICALHPRFQNELPDRFETGLGLSCETAAELIITNPNRVKLKYSKEITTTDEIIILRDKVIALLQNRDKAIAERIRDMLLLCNTDFTYNNVWCDVFLSLERLDEKWTEILTILKSGYATADFEKFDYYIQNRVTEYEQFLVYIIYRHFANSADFNSAAIKAKFAALAYSLVYSIGAVFFTKHKQFTLETQLDIMRMFSAEIEYSDENLYDIFDRL